MKQIRLMAGFLTVGVWTLLSRLMGFVRDIMIASYLGAGPVAEAFLIAFSLPNMFRRFFAEGAFNMAFVPMFSKKLEGGEDAAGFAREAFTGLATVVLVFTLIAQAAMPWLVLAMASGFLADERFDLAVHYGRIAFPYILFISLAALLSGVLNAAGRFVAAAAAPVLLNVLFIGAMVLAAQFGWPIGEAIVWTVPLAGIAQLALVWWAAGRAGFPIRLQRPRLTPDMKRLAVIAAPAALAGGVVQVNLLVGRQVASFFDGAIAWLNYADRLYQLPLGVVGIAIGVVLLPDLSRRLRAGDAAGGQAALSRAGEVSLALTVPCAVALVVIPQQLIGVLFERGAFGPADTAATAAALAIYGLGLPAFVLQKVLQPLYFAREDTKTPFRFALVTMVINLVVAIGAAFWIGYLAAAVATSLSGWVMVLLLWRKSREMGPEAQFDARFRNRWWRIVLTSLIMGGWLVACAYALAPMFAAGALRYLALAIVIVSGIIVYFSVGHVLNAVRLSEFKAAVKRG
ncbi:murein biosynthesis integral membrane protein MurJ [Pseudoruegeria sp. SHC-113]|uniref:murein biosynthesis integral membrane protein MurJ n=1 Tax=Pseudoruegeria sp. SHC-113 TaxID=2855439 RepID=UPI0021BA939B|nr:murein biosynthesis integral membrane protein MurJ [Pseudoruegeria sp. SHC-113]MCT8161228.1 murein biosynthesis integral membrane protein MurJ [Pseudoruegeria sp. SHC-113]